MRRLWRLLMSRTSPFRRAGCLGKAGFILGLLALLVVLYVGADTLLRGATLEATSTVTPEPSPPAVASTATMVAPHPLVVGRVTAHFLNQREGAGVEYAVRQTLQRGDQLEIVANSPTSAWVNAIAPNGQAGWVNSHFLEILEGDPEGLPAEYASVRTTPTPEATLSGAPPLTLSPTVEADEDEADYPREARDIAESYLASFELQSDLALSVVGNPHLFLDQDWRTQTMDALATWQQNGERIRGLEPPDGLEGAHDQILAASGHFDRSGALVREGIEERTPGEIWRAIGEMRLGYDAVRGALAEIGSSAE